MTEQMKKRHSSRNGEGNEKTVPPYPQPSDCLIDMTVSRPGSDDGIAHTGRHYLHPPEVWEDVLPESHPGLTPDVARMQMRSLAVQTGDATLYPWNKARSQECFWWCEPFRAPMQQAFQAYSAAMRDAFQKGTATGNAHDDWAQVAHAKDNRWVGALKGGMVIVLIRAGRSWRVISGYRSLHEPTSRKMAPKDRIDLAELRARQRVRGMKPARMPTGSQKATFTVEKVSDLRAGRVYTEKGYCGTISHTIISMDILRKAYERVQLVGESGGGPELSAWVVTFLAELARLDRTDPPGLDQEESHDLINAARRLRRDRGQHLGRLAAEALGDLPDVPPANADPMIAELELLDLLEAAEAQALILEYLPDKDAKAVRDRREDLIVQLQLEPERFAPASAAASRRIAEQQITPFDSSWQIWTLAARAAEALQTPLPTTAPNLGETLERAWITAQQQGLVPEHPPPHDWAGRLQAHLQQIAQVLCPLPRLAGESVSSGEAGIEPAPLFDFEGLEILRLGSFIEVWAPPECTLQIHSAEIDGSPILPEQPEQYNKELACLALPLGTKSGSLKVVIRLDGKEVRLPVIQLVDEA